MWSELQAFVHKSILKIFQVLGGRLDASLMDDPYAHGRPPHDR